MSVSTSKGDWVCGDAKRDKCNKCGMTKKKGHSVQAGVEIGKDFAEKSKGLFSADDWQCKSCGNINWARRSTCNICNSSKVNTLGERTGFGGGFMERDEVVEYKRKRDDSSDDEYDEFGRKKKKFRKQTSISKSNSSDADDNESDNEGKPSLKDSFDMSKHETKFISKKTYSNAEDEEESGDEEDLSKYDVWGASDDSENEEKQKDNLDEKTNIKPTKSTFNGDSAALHRESSSESSSSSGSSDSSSSSSSSTKSNKKLNKPSASPSSSKESHSDSSSDEKQ